MKYEGGKKVRISGKIYTMYSIRDLVRIMGDYGFKRTSQTIRKWELYGITPPAKFRIRNIRHYTENEVTAFINALTESGIKKGINLGTTDFQELIYRYIEEAREEDENGDT